MSTDRLDESDSGGSFFCYFVLRQIPKPIAFRGQVSTHFKQLIHSAESGSPDLIILSTGSPMGQFRLQVPQETHLSGLAVRRNLGM